MRRSLLMLVGMILFCLAGETIAADWRITDTPPGSGSALALQKPSDLSIPSVPGVAPQRQTESPVEENADITVDEPRNLLYKLPEDASRFLHAPIPILPDHAVTPADSEGGPAPAATGGSAANPIQQ